MMEEYIYKLLEYIEIKLIIEKAVSIFIILVAAYIIMRFRYKFIKRAFLFATINESKKQSLIVMLMSLTKYVIYIVAALFVLNQFIDITPLLAGAGIVGLAIGFGAQSLVKDVIAGFFIMFEEQLLVGDFVNINNEVEGTVEEIGLRMTAIREWSGKKFYISNSDIRTVRNYNRKEMRAIVTVTFPYEENPDKVRKLLDEACEAVKQDYYDEFIVDQNENLEEPPQVYGVTDIDNNGKGVQFTIITKTKPASIWTVKKMIREYIWRACHEHGVEIAYPRTVFLQSDVLLGKNCNSSDTRMN